jgi:hypothetical protein
VCRAIFATQCAKTLGTYVDIKKQNTLRKSHPSRLKLEMAFETRDCRPSSLSYQRPNLKYSQPHKFEWKFKSQLVSNQYRQSQDLNYNVHVALRHISTRSNSTTTSRTVSFSLTVHDHASDSSRNLCPM